MYKQIASINVLFLSSELNTLETLNSQNRLYVMISHTLKNYQPNRSPDAVVLVHGFEYRYHSIYYEEMELCRNILCRMAEIERSYVF